MIELSTILAFLKNKLNKKNILFVLIIIVFFLTIAYLTKISIENNCCKNY